MLTLLFRWAVMENSSTTSNSERDPWAFRIFNTLDKQLEDASKCTCMITYLLLTTLHVISNFVAVKCIDINAWEKGTNDSNYKSEKYCKLIFQTKGRFLPSEFFARNIILKRTNVFLWRLSYRVRQIRIVIVHHIFFSFKEGSIFAVFWCQKNNQKDVSSYMWSVFWIERQPFIWFTTIPFLFYEKGHFKRLAAVMVACVCVDFPLIFKLF